MRKLVLNNYFKREAQDPERPWSWPKETIEDHIRADEIDWMPQTLHGESYHLLVNDEDFCRDKDEKLRLRRQKRKMKFRNAHV